MAIYAFHRVSKDNLVTLQNALREGAWGEVDTEPYKDATEHLWVPILPLLKLRLSQKSSSLATLIGGSSDVLTSQDTRWDAAQKRFVLKISMAEADDDPKMQAAGARLRAAMTLGNGLGQTQLAYDDEVSHGTKQVLLSKNFKRENDAIPSVGEDVVTIGAEANIKEIDERTQEFKKAIDQVTGGGDVTSRVARIKIAMIDCIAELNDAHSELEKQHSAAKNADIKINLKKLQKELSNAIPQEEPVTKPVVVAVHAPKVSPSNS